MVIPHGGTSSSCLPLNSVGTAVAGTVAKPPRKCQAWYVAGKLEGYLLRQEPTEAGTDGGRVEAAQGYCFGSYIPGALIVPAGMRMAWPMIHPNLSQVSLCLSAQD